MLSIKLGAENCRAVVFKKNWRMVFNKEYII